MPQEPSARDGAAAARSRSKCSSTSNYFIPRMAGGVHVHLTLGPLEPHMGTTRTSRRGLFLATIRTAASAVALRLPQRVTMFLPAFSFAIVIGPKASSFPHAQSATEQVPSTSRSWLCLPWQLQTLLTLRWPQRSEQGCKRSRTTYPSSLTNSNLLSVRLAILTSVNTSKQQPGVPEGARVVYPYTSGSNPSIERSAKRTLRSLSSVAHVNVRRVRST